MLFLIPIYLVLGLWFMVGLIMTIVAAIVIISVSRRRWLRILAGVYLMVLTAEFVREDIVERDYDRRFAACVERAKTYVPNVSPEAWCQP